MANALLREISEDEKEWWIKFSYESAERERNAYFINALAEAKQEAMQEGRQKGLQEGRQKGLQEGRQEGRQQGRQEGRLAEKIENARAMLQDGMSVELVAKYSRLPVTEVNKLK